MFIFYSFPDFYTQFVKSIIQVAIPLPHHSQIRQVYKISGFLNSGLSDGLHSAVGQHYMWGGRGTLCTNCLCLCQI